MKAVITYIVIGILCLFTIVPAAPRPSETPLHCEGLACETGKITEITCRLKTPVNASASAPVSHDSPSFLYW